jgi:4-amino-4-deoxy-L-arabinose transferase-like glycosyltransferase
LRSRSVGPWIRHHFGDAQFLFLWTALNLVQVAVTELTSDEGYYWLFSTRMEWGYYEHPPLLAICIRVGTMLFDGELGVRLVNVLVMSAGLGFFLRTMAPRQKPYAYVILLGLPLLGYISFIAFPDSPLVGLVGIAWYVYKRYLERDDLRLALLLAVLVVGGRTERGRRLGYPPGRRRIQPTSMTRAMPAAARNINIDIPG